ncbi:sensor domain-containing diguanylate cyclase [Desulfobacter curvatus]|uniref:sensor domain-containing diguanylate cyclase n=1 Tax=Desulfobacter curvatus TaxID=2290 RepID=UPI001FDFC909|nr:diguanylate cyclase [Desulfobacter curvatus]
MKTDILDALENGVIITDKDLNILFWNRWLSVHTGISQEKAHRQRLPKLFPDTSFSILKRKIRIAFTLKTPSFMNASVEKYVIPIKLNKITKSIFRFMRQDSVITPLDDTQVAVLIYDATQLLEANAVIETQLKLEEKQARIDGLTQCYNKTMFNKLLAIEIKKANRHDYAFSMIILDIDNFKSVNDTFGHLVGDYVLKQIATICSQNIRESDVFARWGGEEFCILLPQATLENTIAVADKLRRIVAAHNFGEAGPQQCSFGVAEYSKDNQQANLVRQADEALYYAKHNGKNRVAAYLDNQKFILSP